MSGGRMIHHLLHIYTRRRRFFSSIFGSSRTLLSCFTPTASTTKLADPNTVQFHKNYASLSFFLKDITSTPRLLSTTSTYSNNKEHGSGEEELLQYETTEEDETVGWEEEEETEPKLGDGGDGGGVVLQGPWGERALSIAREVLFQFGDDIELYAFKTTDRGYVYVRLDKLSNEYGCPSLEELESYCQEYKKRLEEVGALGEIPDDLALEVSSPGAERILKVPDDLYRFKDKPMRVFYVEGMESNGLEKTSVFLLESIETESENCVWKLVDVKENQDPESKGRPLSRKRRDWRLKLPFLMHRRVTLYLEF